jgi:hypothetical protein
MATPCEAIAEQIGGLFSCTPVNEYVRIRTPFLYPDGDVIDLFLKESQDTLTLTDLGETLRWLRGQSISQRRSAKQRQLIEDVCLTHGIELYQGMLMLRLRPGDELASRVTRLAQAALRAADIWFTLRTRAVESATDEVADFLGEHAIVFERGERLPGRSGRTWTVDFCTRTPRRSSLIYVLSTGSRGAARGLVEHVVTAWYDLSHLKVGPEARSFISLFDDTMDVWTEEDFRLVGDLSDVSRWSRPDDLIPLLAG